MSREYFGALVLILWVYPVGVLACITLFDKLYEALSNKDVSGKQ